HSSLNTNAYVESWHRTLKETYLANIRSQRIDGLVYILHEIIALDFMSHDTDVRANLRRRVMNKAEKERQQCALDLSGK
ncbi:hypothetical protein BDC45DRAFT_452920, partial [Circinella umbellata]